MNEESLRKLDSNTNISSRGFNRDRKAPSGEEPSTENIKNTTTEETHWVNTTSSATQNPAKQRKSRVSELSIIDVNDPLPTKCVHSQLDHNLETKTMDRNLQETRTQRGNVRETTGRDMRQEQGGYSSIGRKIRHSRVDEKTNPRWS